MRFNFGDQIDTSRQASFQHDFRELTCRFQIGSGNQSNRKSSFHLILRGSMPGAHQDSAPNAVSLSARLKVRLVELASSDSPATTEAVCEPLAEQSVDANRMPPAYRQPHRYSIRPGGAGNSHS